MHWADVIAGQIIGRTDSHVVATGITPSGHIHVGNMREILTGDTISRALRDAGARVRLIYIGDTFDPLRKVYPFLEGNAYARHVGRPLSEIPCPCGDHGSYAEHFLEPFLGSLEDIGVDHETVLTHELYRDGKYAEAARRLLDNSAGVREILESVSGRSLPEGWLPYTPKCGVCGRLRAEALEYEYPYVHYRCPDPACGGEGKADIRTDQGKLPWRVDWPARWWFLGITCEPFGKDHGAAGGSYDTGARIASEIFDYEAPPRIIYEWIQLKGKGAMSSSAGNVVSGVEMLKMTPPGVLRLLMTKQNIWKHIDFDPGLGLLNLVDEYDRYERIYYGVEEGEEDQRRAFHLANREYIPGDGHPEARKIADHMPHQISYRHLVNVVQIAVDDEAAIEILKRTENIEKFSGAGISRLRQRLRNVRYWLDNFAPDMVKFSLQEELPGLDFSDTEKKSLAQLADVLAGTEWEASAIHNAIYDNLEDPRAAFRGIYKALLGKTRGPRAGYFLSTLDRDFVVKRFREAAGNGHGAAAGR